MTAGDALPWDVLARPAAQTNVSTRRVAGSPHDFFWGLDSAGRVLLILLLEGEGPPRQSLPRLRGIDLSVQELGGTSGAGLLLTLTEERNTDLFAYLCRDVVQSAASAKDNAEAVQAVLLRTLRWHALLKRGAGRLSLERQQGLLGELLFVESELLPRKPAAAAVEAWKGPERAPKDFVFGDVGVEIKTRVASGQDAVRISSEEQLSRSGFSSLFLFVFDVQMCSAGSLGALTLRGVVDRLRSLIESAAPQSVEGYDDKMEEAGYLEDDDYSDVHWLVRGTRLFEVTEDFPRIDGRAGLSPAVSRVEYTLDLTLCGAHVREPDALWQVLE